MRDFLNQIGAPDDAQKYDAYTDDYQTTGVTKRIDCPWQQILTLSGASSLPRSTRPGFANQTYLVLLNGFGDDALPGYAVGISPARVPKRWHRPSTKRLRQSGSACVNSSGIFFLPGEGPRQDRKRLAMPAEWPSNFRSALCY